MVQAAETGGSQRRRSCLPEGSDDSAEDCGAKQSLYAGARYERNADSLCVTRELTAAANSVSGHKHPDRDTALRVCDWSAVVRNERSARKEQSRFPASPRKRCGEWSGHGTGAQRMCSGCGMQHTSGEDPASSYKTRRSLTAERRLLTLCREPASDKESQPQRPARRA